MNHLSLNPVDINEIKSDSSNYIAEIRRMMYGFGDCSEPLLESASLINDVVQREMKGLVNEACKIADRRDSDVVELEDFLFLFRRDKIKLQRVLKYLDIRAMSTNVNKAVANDTADLLGNNQNSSEKKGSHHQFTQLIDNTGDLCDINNAVDEVANTRRLRSDLIISKLETLQYYKWHKARTASFANRYIHIHKFNKWIDPEGDFTISPQATRVTRYLAYETVAQIMDLVFLVRQDQNKLYGDSLDRLKLNYHNPTTYKPYQHGEGSAMKPITPGEIHEALRRYWSPQLDSMGPFYRQSMHREHQKFLAL